MNYYKRHLGDYAKDTKHLTLAEHGAFTVLLDYYYATEKPIPDDRCERIANAYADYERAAVRAVLAEFFTQTPDGWINARADSVIGESNAKSLKAKESAGARWRKEESERNANASKLECERNASHKPLATSHKRAKADAPTPVAKAGKTPELTLTDWIANLGDADAVPADDPIFEWSGKQGIPADWLAYAWSEFEARYTGVKAGKTYTDWRAAFRDHVRRDWLGIWRHDAKTNTYVLTTAGVQWQRELSA